MLDSDTKQKIDSLRNILVGKIPNPQSQVEQITTGLIYKFMYDMDQESIEMGGEGSFFVGDYEKYSWNNLFDTKLSGVDKVKLYSDAIEGMYLNPNAPELFRNIFKNAFLPFKDPSTLNMFLKEINEFHYSHSEKLGDAFEYLISIMGSQGDAGQFRTPRHIIDFIVEIINPEKHETVLDPACGTAGFLISSYKHILKTNTDKKSGDLLSASDRKKVGENIGGYDISPEMIKLSLVNMYLHGFSTPDIEEYDTLSSEDKWNEYYDVILANPPFFSPAGGIQPHQRFGVQSTKAEVLFTSYILEHLKPNGRAGIIVPEGIIFQTGKAYKELRKQLIENALIGVISLPAGVFNPYSGVKTSVLILDKKLSKEKDSIFFAEVKNDGFNLGAQRQPIKENDLPNIVEFLSLGHESQNIHYSKKSELLNDPVFNLSGKQIRELEIQTDFEMVRVGELVEIQSGYAFQSKQFNESEGIPLIRIRNIKTNKTKTLYSGEYSDKYIVNNGDLLVGMDGEFNAVIWQGGKALLNQRVCKLLSNEKVLPYYLFLIIQKTLKEIEEDTFAVTVKHISVKQIKDIEIPLPPLEVQQEIVDELEGYQKIIDGCKQVVENYKPTIDIDPSWEMVELGEFTDLVTKGSTPTTYGFKFEEKGINFIKIQSISSSNKIDHSKVSLISEECHKQFKRSQLQENDILISIAGTEVGICSLVTKEDLPANTNQALAIIRLKLKAKSKFLFYYLSSNIIKSYLEDLKTGVAQFNLSLQQVKQIKVPAIDQETSNKFVKQIEEERKVIEGNKKLIEIYTQKIQDRINKVWGEE